MLGERDQEDLREAGFESTFTQNEQEALRLATVDNFQIE